MSYLLVFWLGQGLKLLDEGDIDKKTYSEFFEACLKFHKRAFIYAISNFPLDNVLLKNVRFINFLDQKCSFEAVSVISSKLSPYITFTKEQKNELEQEFLLLQSINITSFEDTVHEEAAIRTNDDGENIT